MADITITGLPNASTLTGTERVPMDQAGATVDASAQTIANLATAASVGLGNSNNTSDLNKPISTATQAALDGKAAASHTQAASTITGLATVATSGAYTDLSGRPGLAAVATSGVYTDLTGRPTLGTAAPLDVPATGDASATQVAKGNDSRLSDARTPVAHNQAASTITGLATVATSASASDLTTGTLPAARIPATAVTAGSYGSASLVPVITVGADGRITAASTAAVSGGGGGVSSVTGTAPIVSSGGTTPAISISIGTTTGTVAAGDDSRITGALSAATAATTYQPLDADLTSIAALSTASAGRSLLTLAAVPSGALVGTTDTQTLAGKTLGSLQETLFTITDAAAFEINPANGPIQTITLGANRTPAATSFASGQSVKLKIDDGTAYAITWTTVGVVWIGQTAGASGTAPTLGTTGWTHIELWKEGSIVYGALIGYSAT